MKWLRVGLITILLAAVYITLPGVFNEYDSVLTAFFSLRGNVRPDTNIVIASVDDASILEIGDWPWNRAKIAELVDSIAIAQPKVIFLNFFFRKKNPVTDEEKAAVQAENEAMAQAVRRAGNVVIPFNFVEFKDENAALALEMPSDKIRSCRVTDVGNDDVTDGIFKAKSIQSPEPQIAEAAQALGFNTRITVKGQGQSRFTLQVIRYGNDYYPSIAMAAASRYLGTPLDSLRVRAGEFAKLPGAIAIPIDNSGTSMINFCGPAKTFPNISAFEIMGKNFNRDRLRGKIVIVGLTDVKNSEPQRTPYTDKLPSSELWANILNNILSPGNPALTYASLLFTLFLPLLIVLGLAFLTLRMLTLSLKTSLLLSAGAFAAVFLIGFVLFLGHIWLSIFVPLLYLAGLMAYRIWRHLRGDKTGTGAASSDAAAVVYNPDGRLVRIGRYQIMAELGSGSMGTVYKGIDPKINRVVAIKTLKLAVSLGQKKELLERLSREAHAAGNLSHPHIVTIYDYGETENMSYIVMEYLEGESLEARLAAVKKLPAPEAVRIVEQIAAGLDTAHAAGVIHRDIKPANIMLLPGALGAKIMDFGVAKIMSATMTETGKTLGTPYYMSPEQINGEVIDARSDIFSLAVIAYEALCGKRPFTGENISALSYAILHKEPQSVSEIVPEYDASLNDVFARALAKDRSTRFDKATEFSRALKNALERKRFL